MSSESPTILASEAVWTNADLASEDGNTATGAFVGVDLGTSNSCLGLWHPGKNRVKIIKNRHDEGRITPSVVYFLSEDKYVVGKSQLLFSNEILEAADRLQHVLGEGYDAIKQARLGVDPCVRAVKRIIGLPPTSPQVLQVASNLPFKYSTCTSTGEAFLEITMGRTTIRKRPQVV